MCDNVNVGVDVLHVKKKIKENLISHVMTPLGFVYIALLTMEFITKHLFRNLDIDLSLMNLSQR